WTVSFQTYSGRSIWSGTFRTGVGLPGFNFSRVLMPYIVVPPKQAIRVGVLLGAYPSSGRRHLLSLRKFLSPRRAPLGWQKRYRHPTGNRTTMRENRR